MKKTAISNISLADSEYKSISCSNDDVLTISLISWDAKPIKIIFKKAVQFSYILGSGPVEIYEIDYCPELEKILEEVNGLSDKNYQLYHIVDIEGLPFIQVVAKTVNILKEE